MIQITVADLIETDEIELGLTLVSGSEGLQRRITQQRIQKSGLVLTGLFDNIHAKRIQILGNNELSYLKMLAPERQKEVLTAVAKRDIPCFIVTRGLEPLQALIEVGEELALPVLSTDMLSSSFIINLHRYLEINLAASTTLHGVLVDVLGVGILLIGQSGVGKSECALELIQNGHRLVADDVVMVRKTYPSTIWGACSPTVKHHMEIRGLGILNIAELFGVTSVRDRKKIHMVIELVEWDGDVEVDRLGLEHKTYPVLDTELPLITVPVYQGRNTAAIVDLAARNFLLQERGIHSALSFQHKLDARMLRERMSMLQNIAAKEKDGTEET